MFMDPETDRIYLLSAANEIRYADPEAGTWTLSNYPDTMGTTEAMFMDY